METVDLKTAATNALSFFQNRIDKESVTVDLKFPRADLLVVAEDIRLEQVVINLLANALDAMAENPEKDPAYRRAAAQRPGNHGNHRYRLRHRQERHFPGIRSFLYDEGAGKRPRAWTFDQQQDHPGLRGHDPRQERARKGSDLRGLAARRH